MVGENMAHAALPWCATGTDVGTRALVSRANCFYRIGMASLEIGLNATTGKKLAMNSCLLNNNNNAARVINRALTRLWPPGRKGSLGESGSSDVLMRAE